MSNYLKPRPAYGICTDAFNGQGICGHESQRLAPSSGSPVCLLYTTMTVLWAKHFLAAALPSSWPILGQACFIAAPVRRQRGLWQILPETNPMPECSLSCMRQTFVKNERRRPALAGRASLTFVKKGADAPGFRLWPPPGPARAGQASSDASEGGPWGERLKARFPALSPLTWPPA
jgi:hypothetical protein